MKRILWISDCSENSEWQKSSLESLTAAQTLSQSLGAELWIGVFGKNVAGAVSKVACTANVLGVEGEDFVPSRYGTDAVAIEALVKASGADMVIAADTSRLHRVLPGVAYRLRGSIDTHVTGFSVEGEVSLKRWYYKQRIEVDQKRNAKPWFISIDPGNFSPWAGTPVNFDLKQVSVEVPAKVERTRTEGYRRPAGDEQTIRPDADLLFVAGAGWTKKQPDGQTRTGVAAELILNFLKKTRASLGGSKSIVDLGGEGQAVLPFMTHLNQVGQTGASPRHPKGLAACCHGEEPHVIGWRFIKERRAINLDPNCGWAQGKADVLYVADAYEVMSKVNELLS